jgi:hypothetical protein
MSKRVLLLAVMLENVNERWYIVVTALLPGCHCVTVTVAVCVPSGMHPRYQSWSKIRASLKMWVLSSLPPEQLDDGAGVAPAASAPAMAGSYQVTRAAGSGACRSARACNARSRAVDDLMAGESEGVQMGAVGAAGSWPQHKAIEQRWNGPPPTPAFDIGWAHDAEGTRLGSNVYGLTIAWEVQIDHGFNSPRDAAEAARKLGPRPHVILDVSFGQQSRGPRFYVFSAANPSTVPGVGSTLTGNPDYVMSAWFQRGSTLSRPDVPLEANTPPDTMRYYVGKVATL